MLAFLPGIFIFLLSQADNIFLIILVNLLLVSLNNYKGHMKI